MSFRIDAKGKVFTDVIRKEHFRAFIQTILNAVRGEVYVRPGLRFKDELNGSEQFIAVTNAEILSPQGEVLAHTEFLTVNKDHIVWVRPEEEDPLPSDADPVVYADSE